MNVLEQVHQMVWGPWTLVIFLGVGIFFTLKCHFFQIRGFLFWWSRTAGRLISGEASRKEDGTGKGKGISQFQSVCTALAATVGTGNIAGVATALTAGGPGALFWMWVSALIGMITAYAETMLGIRYRYRDKDGHYICGPFIYMERGLGLRGMGVLYSFLCLMSSLGMGSMVQANSAISTMEYTWHVPALAGGLIFTGLLVLVTWGGIRRIGNVAEKLVPAASGIYIAFSMIVILSCLEQIPGALASMVCSAFRPEAAAGGTAGYVISRSVRYGISRGVFSNEAGLGSAPIAAAAAQTREPVRQGLVTMTGTFIDTIVVCTMTGLAIVLTESWVPELGLKGVQITTRAFQVGLPFPSAMSAFILMLCLIFFAFTTILGWNYYGERCLEYFTNGNKAAVKCYRWLYIAAVFIGPYLTVAAVWTIADIFNALMALPNIVALLALSGVVAKETRAYFHRDLQHRLLHQKH